MRASERAYLTLRDEILRGKLSPGEPLAEVEQSTRLGVSRTPVREAFSRLIADGLVTVVSPRLLVVSEISIERIRSVFELRVALEPRAAFLSASRRDANKFERLKVELSTLARHMRIRDDQALISRYFALVESLEFQIAKSLQNALFADTLAITRLHTARIRLLSRHDPTRLQEAADEHILIMEAIIAGDGDLAAHATHVHLHQSFRAAMRRVSADESRTP